MAPTATQSLGPCARVTRTNREVYTIFLNPQNTAFANCVLGMEFKTRPRAAPCVPKRLFWAFRNKGGQKHKFQARLAFLCATPFFKICTCMEVSWPKTRLPIWGQLKSVGPALAVGMFFEKSIRTPPSPDPIPPNAGLSHFVTGPSSPRLRLSPPSQV